MSNKRNPELCAMAHKDRRVQKHPGCSCPQHGDGRYLPWRKPPEQDRCCSIHGHLEACESRACSREVAASNT